MRRSRYDEIEDEVIDVENYDADIDLDACYSTEIRGEEDVLDFRELSSSLADSIEEWCEEKYF